MIIIIFRLLSFWYFSVCKLWSILTRFNVELSSTVHGGVFSSMQILGGLLRNFFGSFKQDFDSCSHTSSFYSNSQHRLKNSRERNERTRKISILSQFMYLKEHFSTLQLQKKENNAITPIKTINIVSKDIFHW